MDHTAPLKAATIQTKMESTQTRSPMATAVRSMLSCKLRAPSTDLLVLRAPEQNDCGITKPANVISTSYGYNEADLSPFYTARQCAECVAYSSDSHGPNSYKLFPRYAKLGLMGVTVVYSSGDNGVAGKFFT